MAGRGIQLSDLLATKLEGVNRQIVCAVCYHPLDQFIGEGMMGRIGFWRHTIRDKEHGEDDHTVVPTFERYVPEVIYSCDFCCEQIDIETGRWLKVNDFQMARLPEGFANSVEDWIACPTCAALIDAGDWDHLVGLVVAEKLRNHPNPYKISEAQLIRNLEDLYAAVRQHMVDNKTHPLRELINSPDR